MTAPVDTTRLRELLAKATPGEWDIAEVDWAGLEFSIHAPTGCIAGGLVEYGAFSVEQARINAALIVALRNAAPALLDELEALRHEAQSSRGLIASFQIRMDILREVLSGTYESGWPSNEYECDVYEQVVALRAERDVISKENANLIADRAFYIGETDKFRNEVERLRAVTTDWLVFSSDVQASCAAGNDWLDSLKARTSAALEGSK